MNANQTFGLVPSAPLPKESAFVGALLATGASLVKSGECNMWDKKCMANQSLLAEARLEEAKAAQIAAESNQQAEQQKMYLLAGGGALILMFLMAMIMKR